MARNDQAIRIIRILKILEARPSGLKISEIKDILERGGIVASARTIYRDLEVLCGAEMPVENSDSGDEQGVWKLSGFAKAGAKITLSLRELFGLYLSREALRSYEGSPIFEAITSVFAKIEALLGERAAHAIEEFTRTVAIKPQERWSTDLNRDVLDTLYAACVEGNQLEITYTSAFGEQPNQPTKRRVGPECLYFADAGVYLVAYDYSKEAYRTFAAPRILEAVMLEEAYESTVTSPEAFFQHSFGVLGSGDIQDVRIEVRGPLARYVAERRWHASQKVTVQQNACVIEMKVNLNEELVSWILSLGSSAKVESPDSLASMVSAEAQKIANTYKTDRSAA